MVDPNAPDLGHLRHLLPVPPWRKRLPLLAVVAYVGSLAIWVDGGAEPRGVLVALVALAIAFVATRRASAVARWLGWGLALVVASLGARAESRGLGACGGFGAMVCTMAACTAVARLPSAGGLVRGAPWSPRAAVAVIGAAWSTAIVAALAPDREVTAWMTEHARAWA